MPRPTFHALPEDKRRRVTQAAVAEFAAWPFGVASLDRIAAASRVSKGSLYQYFEDKQELYRWLVTEHLPARKRATQRALAGDLFTGLESAFHAGLALFQEEPALAALGARLLLPAAEPEVREIHAAVHAATHAGLRALVERGQADGVVRGDVDPDVAADLVAALMGTTLLAAVARRAGVPFDALVADPARARALPPEALDATVRELSGLLRRAIGAAPTAAG